MEFHVGWFPLADLFPHSAYSRLAGYEEQEQSAYNGYFESVCYHPLFLFSSE